MTWGLTIPITKEAISRAERVDSPRDLVAEAIAEALPEVRRIVVDLKEIRFTTPDGTRHVFPTTEETQRMIVAWDQGHRPKPGVLRLGWPDGE